MAQRLDSNDPHVRFVPHGFKIGHQSVTEFIKNPLVLAHFGQEAMDSVERVANYLKSNPYISAPSDPKKNRGRYCALLLDKTTKGLALHGAGQGTGKDGYTFTLK